MPIAHILTHVVAVPLAAALVVLVVASMILRERGRPWPALLALLAGGIAGIVSNPNLSWPLRPEQAEDWLGPTLLLAALVEWCAARWPKVLGSLRFVLAVRVTWILAVPVRDFFEWTDGELSRLLVAIGIGWSIAVSLHRFAARRLAAPGLLLVMVMQGSVLSMLVVEASFATAAEALGMLTAPTGLLLGYAWWRPEALDLRFIPGVWVAGLLFMGLDAHFYADLPWRSIILVLLAPALCWLRIPEDAGPRHRAIRAAVYTLPFLAAAVLLDGGLFPEEDPYAATG
ncbi:MAG: hypothetical protein ACYTF3_08715 [Planctomycetota bacterium]|jgi:hypothetical protein